MGSTAEMGTIQTIRPATFLVVEDNPQNLELLVRLLRREGHEVFDAANGVRGLELAREKKPDIALLDVVLPDISGIEGCRQIKTDPSLAGTFVVLISSEEITTDKKVAGLSDGADDYIVRPLPMRELAARLRVMVRLQRAETALRDSGRFSQQIISSAREGIIVLDHDLRYVVWNPFMEELTGVPAAALIGKHPLDIFPFLKKAGIYAHIERALAGEVVTSLDVPHDFAASGRAGWTISKHGPMRGASGEIIGVITTVHDITLRKQAEAKLKHLNTYLDQCVAERTAELRVANESLRAMPQHILEAQEEERRRVARELHDGVNQILSSARFRLRGEIERLTGMETAALNEVSALIGRANMEVTLISRGLRPVELDDLGLAIAIQNSAEEFQARTGVVAEVLWPDGMNRLPAVFELALYRIAQEALTNVEKHARAGRVNISFARNADGVELRIRDDGRGFSVVPRRRRRKGAGLLNIKERATLAGGTVEITSERGKGTEIVARLPLPPLGAGKGDLQS